MALFYLSSPGNRRFEGACEKKEFRDFLVNCAFIKRCFAQEAIQEAVL